MEPKSVLFPLVVEALRLGADEIHIEYKDRTEWVFAMRQDAGSSIADFKSSSPEAEARRKELHRLAKKRSGSNFGAAEYELRDSLRTLWRR